jgi:hypothetical protein
VEGAGPGGNWANIFHTNAVLPVGDFGYDQAALDAIKNGFGSAYAAQFLPLLSNAYHLTGITVVDLSSDQGLSSFGSFSDAGAMTAGATSPEVCYLVNWTIGRRYRGGHPRTYLPGVVTTNVTSDGHVAPSTVSALSSAANTFRTAVNALTGGNASEVTLAVPHYYKNGALQSSPTVDPVLSGAGNSFIGIQRRRIPR